eukprot:TCONS_00038226-protein
MPQKTQQVQHAGLVISMNVGLLSEWDNWKPFPKGIPSRWLLMGGAVDPPKEIQISKRRPRKITTVARAGQFLPGVQQDLGNMSAALLKNKLLLHNYIFDMKITKERALEGIKDLFQNCMNQSPKAAPVIYYSGHGEMDTGNWCFQNLQLGIREIVALIPKGCYEPLIISDSCFSGCWADYCINQTGNVHVLAACSYDQTALDDKDGGQFTQYITGQIPKRKLSVKPVYGFPGGKNPKQKSGKAIQSVPNRSQQEIIARTGLVARASDGPSIPTECDNFVDLVKAQLKSNPSRVLVSFDVWLDEKMSALFADLETGSKRPDWDFIKYESPIAFSSGVTKMISKGFQIEEMIETKDKKRYVYFTKSTADRQYSWQNKNNRFTNRNIVRKIFSFEDTDVQGTHQCLTEQAEKGYTPFSIKSDYFQKTYISFAQATPTTKSNYHILMGVVKR